MIKKIYKINNKKTNKTNNKKTNKTNNKKTNKTNNKKLKSNITSMSVDNKIGKLNKSLIFKSENHNKTPFLFAYNVMLRDKDLSKSLDTLDSIVGKFIKKFSPLSGSEPKYEPRKWNDKHDIKNTHNCYSYALNQIVSKREGKPQPGYFSGFGDIVEKDYKSCGKFYNRLKKDSPSLYLTSFDEKCRRGYSKAFIALSNKKYDKDYHFYRQDNNKYWSHKPGRTNAVAIDADGKKIKNPYLANRNYIHNNYVTPCFFFCKPDKLSRTSSIS